MKRYPSLLWLAQIIPFVISASSVQAQILPDNTLPTNSIVTPNCAVCEIEGGTIRGSNLFHSFSEFSVPTNGAAIFKNAVEIQNIISRVTGGSISNIDGFIEANGTANLFLLNPNGIIFGANASLDVGGSFVATTAHSLKFSDGNEFSATNPSTSSVLTVSVPVGLQFGNSAERIVNRSQASPDGAINIITGNPVGLQVQPEKSLVLVGGEVLLEGGNLTAPGGRIDVGSVGANSLVNLNSTNRGLALGYEGVQNFQDILLSQKASIDVTDPLPLFEIEYIGSGDIQLQGRQIKLTEGSQLSSVTIGAVSAGTIALTASESVELIGTSVDGFSSALNTLTVSDGNAGDVNITTQRLILRDGAGISTGSFSLEEEPIQGRSGNLTVTASESVEIIGSSPQVGGSALLVETLTDGDAGNLQITTGRLIIRDGGRVSAATSGAGQGGTLRVNASESVEVVGTGLDREGQVIPSTLRASSTGTGDAGNLTVETNKLRLRDGGEITASSTQAGGGDINITAKDIRLRGSTLISTSVFESIGGGGNIAINSNIFIALEDSDILANAFDGRGGDINIVSPVFLADVFSTGTATPVGRNPGSFEPFRGNGRVDISVAALGSGDIGNFSLTSLSLDQNSLSSLSTNFVSPDQVIADSCLTHRNKQQGSFIVTGTGGLPHNPYDPIDGQYSVTQVQGLTPGTRQQANSSTTNSQSPSSNSWKPGDPIQEAQGMTVTPDGRLIVGTAPELVAAANAEDLVCHTTAQVTAE